MKKQKTQKGITLIALIITIVVLMILAVVAIGAVQDSDIIGHAEDAATKYNTAAKKEEDELNNYIKEIESKIPKTAAEMISEKNSYIAANPEKYTFAVDIEAEDDPGLFNTVKKVYSDLISAGFEIDEGFVGTTDAGEKYVELDDTNNVSRETTDSGIEMKYYVLATYKATKMNVYFTLGLDSANTEMKIVKYSL